MDAIIEHLVHSAEPTIRYKTRVDLLGEDPTLPDIQRLQQKIKRCARVLQLLSERQHDGPLPHHPYAKWTGAHWVLVMLAELKYPVGEKCRLSNNFSHLSNNFSPVFERKTTAPKEGSAT